MGRVVRGPIGIFPPWVVWDTIITFRLHSRHLVDRLMLDFAFLATANQKIEQLLVTVLLQLVVIILAARIGATLARRLGQPFVVGEIAAGLVLGPSCFGALFPDVSAAIFDPAVNDVFGILSQLGLILLLFVVGLEFDFSHLRWRGRAAFAISLTGIALPFLLGLGLSLPMHPHLEMSRTGQPVHFLGFALFMGIAMSITAIPILGRLMMELIVINVGRDLGVIPDSVFCMLVLMALATTVMTTPLLVWFMPGTELEPYIRQSGFLRTRCRTAEQDAPEPPM